jgi:hypothetical protein
VEGLIVGKAKWSIALNLEEEARYRKYTSWNRENLRAFWQKLGNKSQKAQV